MRVLVTGGTGFVGKHVVQELQEKHELILPHSRLAPNGVESNAEPLNLIYPDCTVMDLNGSGYYVQQGPVAVASYLEKYNIEAIVHLAAVCGGIGINKDNPGKFIYENIAMGVNLLEATTFHRVKKFVNLGTVCSYPKFTTVPFKEEDFWNGYPEETNAPYGIAKKTIIEMAIAYHKQYGLNVTNLLPANMAGEYDHFDEYSSHVIPAIIKKFEDADCVQVFSSADIYEKVITLWGTGSASREFLYAGDCARAIALALERDTGPEPINLGTGREITIAALAAMIKEIGNYDAIIEWDSSKPDGQPRRSLDVSRAKERLGWEATTSLEEIIKRTIDWYRQHGK